MKTDTCGCCEPAAGSTPLTLYNRPGLSAVAYRVGTFAAFRQAMLQAIAGAPELAHLRTRLSDDYAITLLEMWAVVADILTFYQERIANEAYLRTARHRDSVLKLARLLDYRLSPGVAATVHLAFTTEKEASVRIPVGLRVQSVPGQDEKPQKFEALEEITADCRLNRLDIRPAPTAVDPLHKGDLEAYLQPGDTQFGMVAVLAPGDQLVVFKEGEYYESHPPEVLDVEAIRAELDHLVLVWRTAVNKDTWDEKSPVFKVKRMLRLFGYNAPDTYFYADLNNNGFSWEKKDGSDHLSIDRTPSGKIESLSLDGCYENLKPGTQLLIADSNGKTTLVTIESIDQVHDTVGPLSDTVSRVKIRSGLTEMIIDRRKVLIYELEGPQIKFWDHTYQLAKSTASVYVPGRKIDAETIEIGRTIEDNAYVPGEKIRLKEIERGRKAIIVDQRGMLVLTAIDRCSLKRLADRDYLVLELKAELEIDPSRAPALLGNVALASHGETVKEEVLGDGDAAAGFQEFPLKKKPVTYVPSSGPEGAASSLQVFVEQAFWQEVPSLFGRSPTEPVCTARIADDGTLSVRFGDGKTGARLPSGRGNVRARYRQGLGLEGRVRAERIKTLLDRPVGLKSVTNPIAAEGGGDPESLSEARSNAPSTVRTFNRAVSLQDFEHLACATGEVAKARATWVWSGLQRAVHLTVAGQQGGTFTADSLQRIHDSLTARRDPNYLLCLDNFIAVPVVVTASLGVYEDRIAAEVEKQARAMVTAALSFENLQFGMPLHLSDIYFILQAVEGVSWVDIDRFHFKDVSAANLTARGADRTPVQPHLRIYPARFDSASPFGVLPAEQACVEVPTEDIVLLTTTETKDSFWYIKKISGIRRAKDAPRIERQSYIPTAARGLP